jgi:hypothetical protein
VAHLLERRRSPARLLEIISPAGFERFFAELVELEGVAQAEPQTLADLWARYELEMNSDSVPGLIQRFDLRFPGGADLARPPRRAMNHSQLGVEVSGVQ